MILDIAFGPGFSSNNLFAKPTRAYDNFHFFSQDFHLIDVNKFAA